MSTPRHLPEPATPDWGGGLRRLRLDVAYDGTDFSGWARQPGRRTVQQVVEEALGTALRAGGPVSSTVAGRTDAGVHALGQVLHVDVPGDVDLVVLPRRLAGLLPDDVSLCDLTWAPEGFDARFSASGRRYRYRVCDGVVDPLRRRDTVSWPRPLDVAAMRAAASTLVGMHDFAAYCKPREGATTIRQLDRLDVSRADDVVEIVAVADAFCHNQVRALVGALLAVGEGRRDVDWPAALLAAGVRDSSVVVAAAHGLTLLRVDYPPDDQLAARASITRQRRDLPISGA